MTSSFGTTSFAVASCGGQKLSRSAFSIEFFNALMSGVWSARFMPSNVAYDPREEDQL